MTNVSVAEQAERILRGDVRSVARALSRVEDSPWEKETLELLRRLFPHTGNAFIVGVTGSPGAGKSTLVDQLASHYRREGSRVGILAVDPTSPFSGGAVLGDRIRMQSLVLDEGVYIRSMATRGQLGGLAPAIHEALLVLDAAGYQVLIVETVGVGQDEVDIVKTADVSLVLLVPGMGDDVQTIKAGIMEIGDVFVINKADREGVHRTEQEMQALLSIVSRPDGWDPPVVRTVATTGQGVAELAAAVADFREFRRRHPAERGELLQVRQRLLELFRHRLSSLAVARLDDERLNRLAEEVRTRKSDPYAIVVRLLGEIGLEEGTHD